MGTQGWEGMSLNAMRAAWDASPTLVVVTIGPDHVLAFQNPASVLLFGQRAIGRPMAEAFPELSAEGRAALDNVYTHGSPVIQSQGPPGVHGASGGEVRLTYVFAPLGEPGERPRGVLLTAVDVTPEARASKAAEQAALLAELSERMNSATDPSAALQQLTDTLVPAVADLAAVVVVPESEPPTNLSRAGAAGTDGGTGRPPIPPSALTIDPGLIDRAGPPPGNTRDEQPSPWEQSLASGRSLLIDIEGGDVADRSDEATNAWFAAAEAHNMAVLPLALAGRLSGAVVLIAVGERAAYTPDDLPYLEQAAARAGAAVSHLRVFRHNRQIALDLQHALLPQVPAGLPGVEVAVRYVAGGPDVEIGGDWWDVYPLGEGRTGIGLGDVAGTGVQAAVIMGQARSAMRAAGLAHLAPTAVLTLLDEQLAGLFEASSGPLSNSPRFATALYAILDAEGETLRVANAGHPPLLMRGPDGAITWVQARPGPPLGLRLPTYDELVVPFPAGSLCIGFTDGLVESRRLGVQNGLDRLEAFLAGVPMDEDVQAIADEALRLMGEGADMHDDIALVVLRTSGQRKGAPASTPS